MFINSPHSEMVPLSLLELCKRNGHGQKHSFDIAHMAPVVCGRWLSRFLVRIYLIADNFCMLFAHVVHGPRYYDARFDVIDADYWPRWNSFPMRVNGCVVRIGQRCWMSTDYVYGWPTISCHRQHIGSLFRKNFYCWRKMGKISIGASTAASNVKLPLVK